MSNKEYIPFTNDEIEKYPYLVLWKKIKSKQSNDDVLIISTLTTENKMIMCNVKSYCMSTRMAEQSYSLTEIFNDFVFVDNTPIGKITK